MAVFMINIELNQACMSDHAHLKEVMVSHGYSQELIDDMGSLFCMPDSLFIVQSDFSVTKIFEEVSQIADSIKAGSFVLVTETISHAWKLAKK